MRLRTVLAYAASLVLAVSALAIGPGSRFARADDPMPLSASGQLTVVNANLYEMWNNHDLGETLDLQHFAAAVERVLGYAGVPAPDVLTLSEVNAESAATVAAKLKTYTGHTYAVGVVPATGPGAVVGSSTASPLVRFETAIVYNTSSVTVSSPASSLIQYAEGDIAAPPWLSLRQATALVTKKVGGARFAVYAVHLPTFKKTTNYDDYGRNWANFLKYRMTNITAYAGATPVIAGDFNRKPCNNVTIPYATNSGYMTGCTGAPGELRSGLWQAMQTDTTEGPGVYTPSRDINTDGELNETPDNIWTTGAIVQAGWDKKYYVEQTPPSTLENEFRSAEDLKHCMYLYEGGTYTVGTTSTVYTGGEGGSLEADGIQGCKERYYSDHRFQWATIAA